MTSLNIIYVQTHDQSNREVNYLSKKISFICTKRVIEPFLSKQSYMHLTLRSNWDYLIGNSLYFKLWQEWASIIRFMDFVPILFTIVKPFICPRV
jgi:hypothetical protein